MVVSTLSPKCSIPPLVSSERKRIAALVFSSNIRLAKKTVQDAAHCSYGVICESAAVLSFLPVLNHLDSNASSHVIIRLSKQALWSLAFDLAEGF